MNAVGVWFYSISTDRYLYLMRQDTRYAGSWGLPGGKAEIGESLLDAMQRECREEIGFFPDYIKLVPLEKFTSDDKKFSYHTFFCCIAQEFQPILNKEHSGYSWIKSSHWPKPMHPGLWSMVNFDVVKEKIDLVKSTVQTSQ